MVRAAHIRGDSAIFVKLCEHDKGTNASLLGLFVLWSASTPSPPRGGIQMLDP